MSVMGTPDFMGTNASIVENHYFTHYFMLFSNVPFTDLDGARTTQICRLRIYGVRPIRRSWVFFPVSKTKLNFITLIYKLSKYNYTGVHGNICTVLPRCYAPPFCDLLSGKRGGGRRRGFRGGSLGAHDPPLKNLRTFFGRSRAVQSPRRGSTYTVLEALRDSCRFTSRIVAVQHRA